MKLLRSVISLCYISVVLAFVLVYPFESSAQTTIVLHKGNTGANDPIQTGINTFDIKLGETFSVDVWFNVGATDVSGITTYITFEDNVFEVIDQNPSISGLQPFLISTSYSRFTAPQSNQFEDPNSIPETQITGFAQMGFGQSLSGSGRFARFELRAIGTATGSSVTIDDDRGHNRDTRMLLPNSLNQPFGIRTGLIINVVGVDVEDIPDVRMEPGEVLTNVFDLDDFLLNAPDNTSGISWSVTGTQGEVTVTINSLTNEVTITADPGFTGSRDYIFTVSNLSVTDSDTMNVGVTYKPEFTENLPNSITINEDESFVFLLDTLARDLDDDSTTIIWSGTSSNPDILVSIDNSSRLGSLQGTQDFNGSGKVVFIITDPKGAKDSTEVDIFILPVNDPPRISGLPAIHILPNEVNTDIRLLEFTTDVDGNIVQTNYSWTGNSKIKIIIDGDTRLTISSLDPSFIGSEEIEFRAWDSNPGLATFDKIIITVGPKPPRIEIPLPDTTIISSNILVSIPYVDLDDFVIDDDDLLGSLIWTTDDPAFVSTNNPIHNAVFNAFPGMHEEKQVVFTVTDPENESAQDTITVLVFNNGRPLIVGLPDVITIAVGTDTTLILDDHVKDDITSPINMQWIAENNSNVSITISSTPPHSATISSVSPTFTGEETVTFTVTDEDDKIDTRDVLIRFVTPGVPIVGNIPDIEITKNNSRTIDLDNFLTFFPESDRQNIQWSFSPTNNNDVGVSLNQNTKVVSFSVKNENFLSSVNFTFTATNTLNNQTGSDAMTVTVTFGKIPILGHLPDIVFTSGDTSAALQLNKFIFDEDTEDDSLQWVVDGVNIIPIDGHLGRGEDHSLLLTNRPGFVGIEDITISSIDPEGNTVSDEVRVFVKSSATLEIKIVPNSVSTDYIDIVTFATDTLIGTPSITLEVGGNSRQLSTHKIGNELAWKADFVFGEDDTGPVIVISEAADIFGGSIKDSMEFTIGTLSKSGGYIYADNNLEFTLTTMPSQTGGKVIVIPDTRKFYLNLYSNNSNHSPANLEPINSYYIGSGLDMADSSNSGMIAFNIASILQPSTPLEQYGIYVISPVTGELNYLSGVIDTEKMNIKAKLINSGLYFLAVDNIAPELLFYDDISSSEMTLRIEIREHESGIALFQTRIDGRIVTNRMQKIKDGVFEVTIEKAEMISNDFNVTVIAEDRAGNSSNSISIPVSVRESAVPLTYNLQQNYPNPFNPVTTIVYQVAHNDFVKLVIYNALGQTVRTLVNQHHAPGIYTVIWDGKNDYSQPVSSGMYVYRLQSNSFIKMRKMILLK